jgi:hypothetical protein
LHDIVVILVISHKSILDENEIKSLKQLYNILGHYPIKFICPEGLDVSSYKIIGKEIKFDFVKSNWLSNYVMFNKFKLWPKLYYKYKKYKYALFYEPDAWVFRDELIEWCDKRYDYIGAPWFENWHDALENSPIVGVGNGGLSLRNVKKTIRLLNRMKMAGRLHNYLVKESLFAKTAKGLNFYPKLLKYTDERRAKGINEDYQIYLLSKVFRWYKIAPVEDALRFSFDVNPRVLYKMNDYKLPFGCHAWKKHDREFWDRYIVLENKNQ